MSQPNDERTYQRNYRSPVRVLRINVTHSLLGKTANLPLGYVQGRYFQLPNIAHGGTVSVVLAPCKHEPSCSYNLYIPYEVYQKNKVWLGSKFG